MLDRRTLLGTIAAVAAATKARAARSPKRRSQPNIVFIMADDLGYADVGCFGSTDHATPNIDSLARDGMRFTDAYSSSSVCSPTRIALITGRYPGRNAGSLDEPLAAHPDWGLAGDQPTFVDRLRSAGYQTSLVGKWHMGHLPQFSPLKHGYDRFFGIRSGGADYFTHVGVNRQPDLWEDDRRVDRPGYMTDLLGERAVAEVGRMARVNKPFLLSLHFTAPHWPWETEQDESIAKSLRGLKHEDGGSSATFKAMVEAMDRNIGRVLAALRQSRAANDTIVIFTSDNGGERFSNMWPFSGRKGELLEGGIRVPLIVRWPGVAAARSTSRQMTITMDWAPTLLTAARAPLDPSFDGTSLIPALKGGALADRILFWRHNAHHQKAARHGRLKYLSIEGRDYLFDVAADPLEKANLAASNAPTFTELKNAWEKWNATMLPYPPDAESADNKGHSADRY